MFGLGWEAWLFMAVGAVAMLGLMKVNEQFSQMMRSGPGCFVFIVVLVVLGALGYWFFL